MESRADLEERLATARIMGDPVPIAATLDALGGVARQAGDHTCAQASYEESLALHHALGDRIQIVTLLNILGLMASDQHDWPRAQSRLAEAATLARAWDEQPGLARSLVNLGSVLCDAGDMETARFRPYKQITVIASEMLIDETKPITTSKLNEDPKYSEIVFGVPPEKILIPHDDEIVARVTVAQEASAVSADYAEILV